jgi:hypothetical protein
MSLSPTRFETMISSTESHTPCEVTCSTCGAGPDRRCGDAYGEFEAGVYCPGRQQDLMAALILDAETLAEITDAAAQEEVTREESARDLDARLSAAQEADAETCGACHTPAPLSLGLCAECAEELDADTQAKPHGAFVENRDSLKAAQRYATEARHLRLEGRHTEARCALNYATSLRQSALDSATRDEFWITQLKHRCGRKSRG